MEQHIRREVYARQATTGKERPRDRSWTASQVVGEALRQGQRFPHVERPLPPVDLMSGEAGSDEAVELRHTIRSVMAKVHRVAKRARIIDTMGRSRRLPPNTAVLCSDVVSTPWTVAEVRDDPDLRGFVLAYLRAVLEWIEADIARRGGRVILAVVHHDEDQMHMHVLSVAEHGLARDLHPGYVAKGKVLDRLTGPDRKVPTGAYQEANAAYVLAMGAFLDRFHRDVASHYGLARCSAEPVRRREWLEMKLERLRAQTAALTRANEARQAIASALESRIAEAEVREEEALERLSRTNAMADDAERRAASAEADASESEARAAEAEQRCAAGEAEVQALIERWQEGRRAISDLDTQRATLSSKVDAARAKLREATSDRDATHRAADEARRAEAKALANVEMRERELEERRSALNARERSLDQREAAVGARERALDDRGDELYRSEQEHEERDRALARREERATRRINRASELLVTLEGAHEQVHSCQQRLDTTTRNLERRLSRLESDLVGRLDLLAEQTDDPDILATITAILEAGIGFARNGQWTCEGAEQSMTHMDAGLDNIRRAFDALVLPHVPGEHATADVVWP